MREASANKVILLVRIVKKIFKIVSTVITRVTVYIALFLLMMDGRGGHSISSFKTCCSSFWSLS